MDNTDKILALVGLTKNDFIDIQTCQISKTGKISVGCHMGWVGHGVERHGSVIYANVFKKLEANKYFLEVENNDRWDFKYIEFHFHHCGYHDISIVPRKNSGMTGSVTKMINDCLN